MTQQSATARKHGARAVDIEHASALKPLACFGYHFLSLILVPVALGTSIVRELPCAVILLMAASESAVVREALGHGVVNLGQTIHRSGPGRAAARLCQISPAADG